MISNKIKVVFLPSGKEVEISPGASILEAAVGAGLGVKGVCGGKGLCGKCRVKALYGIEKKTSPSELEHLSQEDLSDGIVLACQRKLITDALIEIEQEEITPHRKENITNTRKILPVKSAIEKKYLIMSPPSLEDQASDLERVTRELPDKDDIEVKRELLKYLPSMLRQSSFSVTAVLLGNRLMTIEENDTREEKYGIAFDIGTTTIAGSLVDLNSGKILSTRGATNYQQIFGADVISRINYSVEHENGRTLLQKGVMAAMDEIVSRLLNESGISEQQVYEAVVVGNTTMIHLFMGLDAESIARSPFIPVFRQALNLSNRDLGLGIHSSGNIHVIPCIAGFVGADTVAVMLATHIEQQTGTSLVVDIGTNGEIVLAGKGRILTCSTAAGPAFEGAKICYGMRAVNGAIEGVIIDEDVSLNVIGGGSPKGICGSGLIDAVAEMLRVGILDSRGRIADREVLVGPVNKTILDRIIEGDQGREFVLTKDNSSSTDKTIMITQKDIRELQLAKGAICAGIRILLAELELTPRDIDRVFLAGAFGNYIKKDSAIAVGLFPETPADRIYPVGNAAGEGACMGLASIAERKRAVELACRSEHIELSSRKDFQEGFLNAIYFSV